jgi:hypothetical protein
MIDVEEVFVTDLYKKHTDKVIFKNFYTVGKHIYQDDGEIVTESIALDKEGLEVLRAKIMAIIIDEMPQDKKSKSTSPKKTKQTRLF